MGLFERIFPKGSKTVNGSTYWKTLTAYAPVFTTRTGGAYESELVRASIDARARHISKLSIVTNGSAKRSTTTRLKKRPNEFQTWAQFLYRVSTILDMQNTVFIIPVYDKVGLVSGVYPVLPSQCAIVESNGKPWLRYKFNNGDVASMELELCGLLTKFQYEDDFFGGSRTALNSSLDLLDLAKKSIAEAMKNGSSVRYMAQLANFSKSEDLVKEKERFNSTNLIDEGRNGLDLFPNIYKDIKQVQLNNYVLDDKQTENIQRNVYNYFGVSEAILQNKASTTELDAFFNGAIEPFAIQLSEVLTKMIFTELERSNGNEIYVSANRLQYMSTSEKVALVQQLGDRGMLLIDEARELFNYPPLPDGLGQNIPARGEYYMINDSKKGDENDE